MSVRSASTLVDAPAAGVMEVFVLNELPEGNDWKERTSIDLTFLDSIKPNGTVAFAAGRNPISTNLNNANGQYLVYRFRQTGTASAFPAFLNLFSAVGGGGVSVTELGASSDDVNLGNYDVGENGDGGQAGENNGAMPVIGYRFNTNGRALNGLTGNYVPVCLAVSWNGRENVPEYVIEALNKYMSRIDNYDACTSNILDHLSEIVVYGDPKLP
jgi:hypothetical protein